MEVKLSEIKITPLLDTVRREKISDDEYFGEKYKDYISNSRLGLIDPSKDGSPLAYKEGFKGKTDYFNYGSIVHSCVLENYYIVDNLSKPSAKLGLVIDAIWDFRLQGLSIESSIIEACKKVHYYEDKLTVNRIKSIISEGIKYYKNLKTVLDDKAIIISDKDLLCKYCVDNLLSNHQVTNLLHPKDLFDDELPSYNEDAFFIDYLVEWNDNKLVLPFKLKIDNWSINTDAQNVILNDLKTTRYSINQFREAAINKYHYHRQLGIYRDILLKYCQKEYHYNPDTWTNQCNIIAVEKKGLYEVGIFRIYEHELNEGLLEFYKLLKMVAYCEMTEYSNDIIFI